MLNVSLPAGKHTNSSPSNLEVNEHLLIQKLITLKPYGINSCDPFGMPLLFENKTFDNGP